MQKFKTIIEDKLRHMYFVSLVSDMYDTGHVLFEVVGSLKESWCSEIDGK